MAPVIPTETPVQGERFFKVITPLDEDVLLFRRMSGSEELGRLFEFELDLLSTDSNIAFDDVLGQGLTVEIERPDGETRHFNGIVSRFSYVGNEGQFARYRATIKPWLWLLTRTNDCRVFQNKTVPDIIEEVFNHYGFSDFEDRLSRDYSEREYCIQYRESAFDFVSRLMEHEGIYYYFVHEADKHTLILADEASFHEECPGYDTLRYFPPEEFDRRDLDDDHVYDWQVGQQVQSGRFALNDYNFESPKANLEVRSAIPREHAHADFEVYDYPGTYREVSDGDNYVRNRIEEIQAQHEIATGRHNNVGLITGYLFNLTGHTRDDQNREYLVISADYSFVSNAYETLATASSEPPYACRFTAMDARQPFRPARITRTPIVHGMQSAIVTGPEGGEIHTDKYGRVKIRFYWDRHGPEDDNSSCWVRVSQNRAGKEWGEVYLPHVDQEVLVSFEEGDPDRPIITGRVYNNDHMPPLDLPADKTKLIMRDHGGNQMVMEGEDGDQRISFFSPTGSTRMSIGKGFDLGKSVGAGGVCTVDGYYMSTDYNLHQEVAENLKSHVDGWLDSYVQKNMTTHCGGDVEETCEGNKNESILGWANHEIHKDDSKTTIGMETKLTVGMSNSFKAAVDVSVFGGLKVDVKKSWTYSVGDNTELNKKKKGIDKYDGDWMARGKSKAILNFDKQVSIAGNPLVMRAKENGNVTIYRTGGVWIHLGKNKITLQADKIILKGKVETTDDLKVGGNVHATNVAAIKKQIDKIDSDLTGMAVDKAFDSIQSKQPKGPKKI